MKRKAWKAFLGLCLGVIFTATAPSNVRRINAAVRYQEGIGAEANSFYKIRADVPEMAVCSDRSIRSCKAAELVRGQICRASSYEMGRVLAEDKNIKGYLRMSGGAALLGASREGTDPEVSLRNNIVEYALQFVGKPYVWGGSDPHTGADCSGFTAYVMKHMAGVTLTHASWIQATEGKNVKNPRPGDLIFYSKNSRINHVAIYIGGGQIVHASSRKTGIRVSAWNNRTPVKIVDVLS